MSIFAILLLIIICIFPPKNYSECWRFTDNKPATSTVFSQTPLFPISLLLLRLIKSIFIISSYYRVLVIELIFSMNISTLNEGLDFKRLFCLVSAPDLSLKSDIQYIDKDNVKIVGSLYRSRKYLKPYAMLHFLKSHF